MKDIKNPRTPRILPCCDRVPSSEIPGSEIPWIRHCTKFLFIPILLAGFFTEKFRLIDWRWSVWQVGGRRPQ